MRFKIVNLPRLNGFVWSEATVGLSLVVGVGLTLILSFIHF